MELIDRKELLANLNYFAPEKYSALVNDLICKQKIVDAVPVIRCGVCVHSFGVTGLDGTRQLSCTEIGRRGLKEDDFCSYGKLRK